MLRIGKFPVCTRTLNIKLIWNVTDPEKLFRAIVAEKLIEKKMLQNYNFYQINNKFVEYFFRNLVNWNPR